MGTATSNKKFSNLGNFIQKVAGSCLLHSVGRTVLDVRYNDIFSSDDEDELESIDFKAKGDHHRSDSIEIQPLEIGDYEKLLHRLHGMEALIAEVFDTATNLKKAYIRLQVAHNPYDPEKLHLADSAVVAELRRMSELKQSHRKLNGLSGSFAHTLNGSFSEIKEQKKIFEAYEDMVKDLKADVKERDNQIEFLKGNLRESSIEKEKLERRVKKLEHRYADGVPNWVLFPDSPTPELFKSMVDHVKERSRSFTKLLISLMRVAKWDIEGAAAAITPGVAFRKPSHKKYAFESYLCERMFHGFENESLYISGSLSSLLEPANHRRECFSQFRHMVTVKPMEILNIMPDCPLGKFCNKKYLQIVHPKMEEAFFGNFEHRGHVVNGNHPTSEFYQTFLEFAKAVWVLHKLAFSFSRVPNSLNVKMNSVFLQSYMESVVSVDDLEGVPLVAFAISPGFKLVEDFIVKSTVYVVGKQGEKHGDFS